MFQCGGCSKSFSGWRARDNHCWSTGHLIPDFECDTCDACFRSERARWQHMTARNHFFRESECRICDETFPTDDQRDQHEIDDHRYCADCNRSFMNGNNLKIHLNSRIHRGQSIECPFCQACYTTATGMVHHLEGGNCPYAPALDRDEIYRFVRCKDPSGLISKKYIEFDGESGVTYEANSRAWNGYAFECYLCHKEFSHLSNLNRHLNSPAHYRALYHCPNMRCRREFKTLAALINHLESESCGATRFETVQRGITDIVSGNRLITF